MTDYRLKPYALVTETELAEILKISVHTIRQWRVKGYGPRWHKIGHACRYDMESVSQFLEQNLKQSTSE